MLKLFAKVMAHIQQNLLDKSYMKGIHDSPSILGSVTSSKSGRDPLSAILQGRGIHVVVELSLHFNSVARISLIRTIQKRMSHLPRVRC